MPRRGSTHDRAMARIHMCMFSERMQLLLSPEQRRRLNEEAHDRDVPVAAVVREAIDQHLGTTSPGGRAIAAERIASRHLKFVSPERLNKLLDSRFE